MRETDPVNPYGSASACAQVADVLGIPLLGRYEGSEGARQQFHAWYCRILRARRS